ncbi:DUF4282 domain-containing protein [Rhodococcus sp. NPDC127528]|uniref:DUF4282 domain-containing protein n=1 Tax=unclassified Rhodococcus (in: high G+C Gram-positive bacteria) TaxID=192944 RepID=UPI00363322B9
MTTGGPTNPQDSEYGGAPTYGMAPTPPEYTQPAAPYPGPGYGYPGPPNQAPPHPGPAGFGAYPPAPPAGGGAGQMGAGFFSALFDFNFNSYVTPKVVKVLYILMTVIVGLYTAAGVFAGIAGLANGSAVGLLVLVGAPLIGLIVLALMRISLEFYVAVIKVAEDVKEIKSRG